ncbi:helix-turn-helix domain-containing protein [Aeromicrobium terrae]|uniref:PucR family transcriptional regulator n=1 Tax=Aeromicrobium terrae TaxID=2498846 RepID=A0A5C8NFS1_9ACTN|nr:PucR family transcriptional regulator [Aeromicrobium terrae]TXL60744.1 PucR family transcriptional regulator [Aeromicrobium terrae]
MTDDGSRTTLVRVLQELSETLLTVIHGLPSPSAELGGVAFHDPVDEAYLPRNALVLGIGLTQDAEIAELLARLKDRGAIGLVVRGPRLLTDEITRAVDTSGIPLIALASGASWAQLAAMIRSLSVEDLVGGEDAESLGGLPSGDLFALANAVMAVIDAPVTILDRSSRVIAFSGRQDEGDASRIETILGRQAPERFTAAFVERGVFNALYRSDSPVWIEPGPPGTDLPRVAVAVRAGDEVLGSIWAVVREPLSEQRTQALIDATKLVALHMMRLRGGALGAQRLRADLASTALSGGPGAQEALRRLGLAGEAVLVLAMGLLAAEPSSVEAHARSQAERQRLSTGLAVHLAAVHPRCATTLVGEVCYALMPAGQESDADAQSRAARIAGEFLSRVTDGENALIGIGRVSSDLTRLADGRSSADRVLRVLLEHGGRHRRVARFEDVHVETLLLELRDLAAARGDRPTGPVARLIEYDRRKDSQLLETLEAWLDAFGDVATASAALFVHPNTFRYRLRRAVEVSGLDLDDSEARLAAMLQLRIVHALPGRPSSTD